ncbi:MAG: PAS domain-containing protein, partial [Thermoplasmata archaeon]|nr:PAS domain-containing protein [Thermoplasmata archaeon]
MKILLVDPHGTFKSPRLPRGIEIVSVSSDEVEKKLEDGDYNIIIVSEELYDAIGKIKKKPTVIVVPRFKEEEAFQNLLRSVELFGERVLEDESRFRDLFINVPVGLYRTTLEGKIIDANPELLRILGFERVEEVLKKKVEEFYLNPSDRKEFLRKLLKEGTVENHISRLVREGGEIIWVEESARIVKGADGDFIEGAIEDVTERMEAFQALKDSEESFRLFVENAHDGILIIDKSRRIIYANRKAAESLGVSREDLIGKEFSEFLEEGERRIVVRRFEERVKGKSVVSSY